ncbi:hypothetical protein H2200_012269 [Cladophialophora chaetospira]|uniref:C3H1-type domain-containing protein n=1 Tax=Cladophialophora chaetospira TaxID=386627 RepID=A0AA38WYH1_9EURO|nr:hypothetical protein H2200_012269 [Cladophialophora chaetospira]
MSPSGGFANSMGVDFSPLSSVDYSPGPSPTGPIQVSRSKEDATPFKTFNRPPPTAPRSMRHNISPPPLRRADTFRDSGPLDRYEPYTTSRRRYSDDFRRPERAPASDSYRPPSPRRRDAAWEDGRTRFSPRGDKYVRSSETVRKRRDSVTKYPLEQPKRGPEADAPSSTRQATSTDFIIEASKEARAKAREAARLVAEKINQTVKTSSPLSGHDTKIDKPRKSYEDDYVLRDDNGKYLQEDRVQIGATKGMQKGLAEPQPQKQLGIPSHHELCAPHSSLHSDFLRPRNPIILDGACDDAEPVESIEKENQAQPHEGGPFPKPSMKEAPRPSREGSWSFKPASTPSTGTASSRNKNICRACRKPGSTVTPLVPCKICRKGYHVHTPPLPVQSHTPAIPSNPTLPSIAKENESTRSSLDRYSPTDALVLDNPQLRLQSQVEAPSISPSLPELSVASPTQRSHETKVSEDTARRMSQAASSDTLYHEKLVDEGVKSTPKLTDQPLAPNHSSVPITKPPTGPRSASTGDLSQNPNTSTASKAASLRDQYKQITCPSLRKGGCWLVEEHCVFAHKETGRAAPNSNTDAKDFTCPEYAAGRCPRRMRDCKYAHYDTGLYVGLDGKASLKHITCWYWRIKGHCLKNEENCLYAHEETGLLSWQPNVDSQKRGGGANSLKDFICPRFEHGEFCVYEQRGNCPYTHSRSGKSCLAQYRLERFGNRRDSGFDGHASPSSPPTVLARPSAPDRTIQAQLQPVIPAETAVALECVLTSTEEGRSLTRQQQRDPPSDTLPASLNTLNMHPSGRLVEEKAEAEIVHQTMTDLNNEQEAVRCDTSQAILQSSTEQSSSQLMTEQQPRPARGSKKARRGGLGLRPSLVRTKLAPTPVMEASPNPHSFPVVEDPMDAADIDSPNSSVRDLKGAAASSGSIERKKCEGCPKTIYSSGALCQTCAKKPENQHLTDEAGPKPPTHGAQKSTTPLSIEIPDDALESSHLGTLNNDRGSVTSGASYQESAGLLGRKRPATDHLFVAAKRRRNSQTARDAAIALLRQERRAASGGVLAELNTQGLSSLGDLTNLAMQERMASERRSTEENTAPSPSVRQNSIETVSRDFSVGSSSKTSHNPPLSSTPECQTSEALKLPLQVSAKSATRSSSIGSMAELSLRDENVAAPQMITTAETGSPNTAGEVHTVRLEPVADRSTPDKDDFTEDEHELFVEAYILHPKMFNRIAESLPGRTIRACLRHFLATGGVSHYQALVQKAAKQGEEEAAKQKRSTRAARKNALAPGLLLQAKRPTGESDESSIEDGDDGDDDDCEQDMPLENDVEQGQSTTKAPPDGTPARTPAPTDQTVTPAQLSSGQPHMTQVQQTPISSPQRSAASSPPMSCCPRCKGTHKRCWHKMDCSPDPLKCEMLIQEYGPQGPSWFNTKDWKIVFETANQAILEKFAAKNGGSESTEQTWHTRNTDTDLVDDDGRLEREDSSPLTTLTQAEHEEDDDDEDDVRPLSEIRFSSFTSVRPPRGLKSTTSKTAAKKASRDMPQPESKLAIQVENGTRPSFSPLTTVVDSPDASRTATEGDQDCSKENVPRALQRLKDQHPGIIFDTESEDEMMEEDNFQPPPPTRVDALWQRPVRSRNLFDIDPSYDKTDPANRLAAGGVLPSSTRPSKKQLMGEKLLLYQCAERKKRFGNPHQEVRRHPVEALVTTTVQRDIDFDNSQGVRARTEKVTMTFRDFLGAPKDPVIEARKDQLVFREKEAVQQVAGRHGRARRVLENEVFPFVYSANAK